MKPPVCHIATPYGTKAAVYFDPTRSANMDDCYFHDVEGCMSIAGVYGRRARQECREEIDQHFNKGSIPLEVFLKHGGHKVPRQTLGLPETPVYPRLPKNAEVDIPIESWVTLAMDHAEWDTRAPALLEIIDSNLDQAKGWALPKEVQALALAQLLTASIEHLHEKEIDCIESAAMYALTLHPTAWSDPAVAWLEPFKATWFKDWCRHNKAYARFARLMRIVDPSLPAWIVGGAK